MNITVYGAAGDVGKRIVSEALARGHNVIGVVRTKAQFGRLPDNVRPYAVDVSDQQQLAPTMKGQDLVISALRPPEGHEDDLPTLTRSVLDGSAAAGVRVLLVGGTGRYRLGTDTLVVDESGVSRISMEDFAMAVLDEAEVPKHVRRAFTVGY